MTTKKLSAKAAQLRWLAKQPPGYNAEKARKYRASRYGLRYRLKRYGITLAQYDAMVISQGGKCAICGRASERLVVDHDHVTGMVRGLLCDPCNLGIGKLGDTVAALIAATAYLAKAVK